MFGDVNGTGSSDTPAPVFGSVCAAIRGSGVTVALSTGDALRDLADSSTGVALGRWEAYMDVEDGGLEGLRVWRTAGDNDRLDVPARLRAWNLRFAHYPTSPDPSRRWFSRNVGGMHVVFLNTAWQGHRGWIGYDPGDPAGDSAQARWLLRDLKMYTAAHPGRSRIVVVTHYPLVNGKTDKPYAGTKKSEATSLRSLFARYGVDMVIAGDTHVFRRTMVKVTKNGRTYRVPYVHVPPAASTPRTFGADRIPALRPAEAGWAPGARYRGFIVLRHDTAARTLRLLVRKVAVSGGIVSSAEDQRANATALGGRFADVPVGARL